MELLGERMRIELDNNKVYVKDDGIEYENPLELTDAEKRLIKWAAGNISILEKRNRKYILLLERAMEIYGIEEYDKELFLEKTARMNALQLELGKAETISFGWFLEFRVKESCLIVQFFPAVKKPLWDALNGTI